MKEDSREVSGGFHKGLTYGCNSMETGINAQVLQISEGTPVMLLGPLQWSTVQASQRWPMSAFQDEDEKRD